MEDEVSAVLVEAWAGSNLCHSREVEGRRVGSMASPGVESVWVSSVAGHR